MGDNRTTEELAKLRSKLSATEELLSVHEQAVLAQSDKLEAAMSELMQRQLELENLTTKLSLARDEALKASQLKSQFLANMSHEIRTPISTVIGMAELLLDTDMSGDQKRLLGIINDSAQSLLGVINDILDFSKMEAGKIALSPGEFSLADLSRSCNEMFEVEAHKKGLSLRLTLPENLPESLVGDAQRLKQVLMNLLNNAVKFTVKGQIEQTVEVLSADEREAAICISVRDTGVGLPAEALTRIFDPFVQIDGTSTRQTGGTGLGLSISRDLVRNMGGEITVISQPGVGSTFAFTLTLLRAPARTNHTANHGNGQAAATLPAGPANGAVKAKGEQARILVAEDNPILQELAVRQLQKLGYKADGVSNGLQSVEAAMTGSYDFILMDCQMPGLDGFAATRQIRQGESALGRHTPIVAMTAGAMPGDRERCLEAGMDDYMAKPVRIAELKATLDRFILKQ